MKNLGAITLLFIANAVSGIAQGISMIAIPWYFTKTGDSSFFGYLYAMVTLVSFIWGPMSGTFVDKYNRKHIFLFLTTISGVVVLSTAGFGIQNGGLPWYLVGLVFLTTFMNYNLHYPNLYAFVQEISEPKHYSKISSYIEIQGQTANMLAGAAGALLLEGFSGGDFSILGRDLHIPFSFAPWEIQEVFLLDGCTYIVAFAIISLIKFESLKERLKETGNLFNRFKLGYQFLSKNTTTLIFGLASYVVFASVLVTTFYISAKYVSSQLEMGGHIFALSEMFFAFGAIMSGFFIQRIFHRYSIPFSIIILTLLAALQFFILSLSQNTWVFFGMTFLLGMSNAGIRIQRITYLFSVIPNQFFGRAGSIFFLFNLSLRISLILLFSIPFFHADDNIRFAYLILGSILLIAASVLIRFRHRFLE